jgi:apolipoprotein D and lipocalin family protein
MIKRSKLISSATLITLSTLWSSCHSTSKYEKTVDQIEMNRFMTKWYVIATRPTFLEKDAYNATETYTFNTESKRIEVDFQFNKGSLTGPTTTIPQIGWVHNEGTNAHWKIQPKIWWIPFTFDYLIIGIDKNYEWTAVGVPDQKYLWIMANNPKMTDEKLADIKSIVAATGYDVSNLIRIDHN